MLYLIFTLFIFYTVCCCLDGSDLKPKWQKWLGNKLHNFGDNYVKQPKYNLPSTTTSIKSPSLFRITFLI